MNRKMRDVLLFIALLILAAALILPRFYAQKPYTAAELGIPEYGAETDADHDGIDDAHDILLSARAYIETKPLYKSKYYEGGYPDDGYGVCTDVIWQAFMGAGYDLKSMVDADIAEKPEAYPGVESPDPNIDFRRVRNLKVFLDRNAENLPLTFDNPADWQPGDIVVIGKSHIAICSDKRNREGIPFILHHDGRGAREKNELTDYTIVGHYRFPPSSS